MECQAICQSIVTPAYTAQGGNESESFEREPRLIAFKQECEEVGRSGSPYKDKHPAFRVTADLPSEILHLFWAFLPYMGRVEVRAGRVNEGEQQKSAVEGPGRRDMWRLSAGRSLGTLAGETGVGGNAGGVLIY